MFEKTNKSITYRFYFNTSHNPENAQVFTLKETDEKAVETIKNALLSGHSVKENLFLSISKTTRVEYAIKDAYGIERKSYVREIEEKEITSYYGFKSVDFETIEWFYSFTFNFDRQDKAYRFISRSSSRSNRVRQEPL